MDASSTPDFDALQKPLEHFRAKTKRLKIHQTEVAILWIVCIQVVCLPWALGGMRLWAQIPSLVLALIGFVLALKPRHYTEDHTGAQNFRLIMWPRSTTCSSNATTSAARPAGSTSPRVE